MSTADSTAAAHARKRTLTEISTDYSDLERLMDEIDLDAISDEDKVRLEDFELGLANDRDAKFDNYGGLIQDWAALGKAQVEEGDRIKALGAAKLNKVKFLKARLLSFFVLHNIDRPIETLRYKFSRQANGGVAPVELSEQAKTSPVELPEQYRRVRYEPDLEMIREDLLRLDEINLILTASKQIALVVDSDSDMDELRAMYAKGFIDRVLLLDHTHIEEWKSEKADLERQLDGVATLGERGEHLRIR